jgi:hypothetical protein
MSEDKVGRKIFGPKKGEGSEQFRIFHNRELCASYISPDVRTVKWDLKKYKGGGGRHSYRILTRKAILNLICD